MLINTLQTLVMAGKDALRTTCGLPVMAEDITQVRHGNLTFPSLGEITFSGGTLQHLHLGCNSGLCQHLAKHVPQNGPAQEGGGLETLAHRFLENVLEEMEGRHAQGWVENLEVGPRDLATRGVRTFGFRFRTDVGNLYLMAEVPSKAELELAKGSDYLATMVGTYLPENYAGMDRIDLSADLDKFLIFMRKTELDCQVEVPEREGLFTVHTGTLVEITEMNGQRALRWTMDISESEGQPLRVGDPLNFRVGVQDRALNFQSTYLGKGAYPIAGSASVKSVLFSVPESLQIEQRRRAFRINPEDKIPVEIFPAGPEGQGMYSLKVDVSQRIKGSLADISFSGARIVTEREKLLDHYSEGSRILCRLHFPEGEEPLDVQGLVRRATVGVKNEDEVFGEVGLEFVVNEDMDRSAIEYIRQYVLAQQRAWLAQRIHVAGAPQW